MVNFDTLEFVPGKGGYYVHDIRLSLSVVLERDVVSTDCSNMFLSSASTKSTGLSHLRISRMYIYVLYEYAIEKIALYTVYRSVHNTHMLYDITYTVTDFPKGRSLSAFLS